MKKIFFISVMLMFIFIFSFTSCSKEIEETTTQVQIQTFQSSCPRGEVNCEYPGKCYLYTDENNNDFCDNGEIK
jgi:hypothetical protein